MLVTVACDRLTCFDIFDIGCSGFSFISFSNISWGRVKPYFLTSFLDCSISDILPVLLTGIKSVKNSSKDIKVVKRKLSYYTSLVSLLGGAL